MMLESMPRQRADIRGGEPQATATDRKAVYLQQSKKTHTHKGEQSKEKKKAPQLLSVLLSSFSSHLVASIDNFLVFFTP